MQHDKTPLVNFIKHTNHIPQDVAQDIAGQFEEVTFAKNEFILRQGKVCDTYLFLSTGFARAYTHDTEGNEVTTGFCVPQSVVFEVASFFKRIPTQENIQALTDCTGWKVSFQQLNHLFHSIPEFREFGRMILVNGFVVLKERMLSMVNHTAEQRYEQLLAVKPEIFQHTPLKYIASYLGVTDTSLSRIRKEMAKPGFLPNDKKH